MAGSPNGSWNDQAQSALASRFVGNLHVDQELRGHWAEGPGHLYSYRLTMHAEDTRVMKWAVGFGDLPQGTSLSKSFIDAFWGEILRNGTDGAVLLGSPKAADTASIPALSSPSTSRSSTPTKAPPTNASPA